MLNYYDIIKYYIIILLKNIIELFDDRNFSIYLMIEILHAFNFHHVTAYFKVELSQTLVAMCLTHYTVATTCENEML